MDGFIIIVRFRLTTLSVSIVIVTARDGVTALPLVVVVLVRHRKLCGVTRFVLLAVVNNLTEKGDQLIALWIAFLTFDGVFISVGVDAIETNTINKSNKREKSSNVILTSTFGRRVLILSLTRRWDPAILTLLVSISACSRMEDDDNIGVDQDRMHV